MPRKDPEEARQYARERYWTHRAECLASCKKYNDAHKVERQAYRDVHKQEINEYHRQRNWALKIEALEYYSTKGHPNCLYCGEDDVDVLCIDHIDNDGARHRKAIGCTDGSNFYKWLKKNNYPEGFQVLCYNCNMKKAAQFRRSK